MNVSLWDHLATTGRFSSLPTCAICEPGSVVPKSTSNPLELLIPTTSITTLNPLWSEPSKLPPLLTFLNWTASPTTKWCGFSVVIVVIPVLLSLLTLFKIRRFLWAVTSGMLFVNSVAPATPTVLDSCKV